MIKNLQKNALKWELCFLNMQKNCFEKRDKGISKCNPPWLLLNASEKCTALSTLLWSLGQKMI
jgi:hypothetical protein